jgi:ATP-dependent Clp protease ATP-binding subunit ClpX
MFEMPESNQTKLVVDAEYAENKLNKSTLNKLKAVS